ncbi:MAG: FtsX-like permease family protein [Pirellulales bacterium]|nr:FtsX-like permease family protein [Pirellulales bacterium]
MDSAASTATAARHDFSSSVLATGAIQAQVGAEVQVGARISGKVERLLANIGDNVIKGQVVAELEKADLEATVAQREAELRLAAAKLAAVENLLPKEIQKAELDMSRWLATRTLCEQEVSRESRLLKSEATSEQSFEQAQERLAVVKAQLASAEKEIREFLRQRHRLRDKPDDFTIQNQATLLATERETAQSMTLLVGSVGGISLVVGGVGILAVMLISVRERTPEIGLRRALGATRGDIRFQFLIESALLAGTGGLVGVFGGVVTALAVSQLGYWEAVISWPAVLAGFGFSVAVGLVFGIYPAIRAAALEPIEALRSE